MKSTKRDNQVIVVNGKAQIAKVIDRGEAMEKAEMFVVRNLPKYLKKMHELALGGFYLQKTDQKGNLKIYVSAPDRAALEYLIERGLGKVPQRHEITGGDGGPVEVLPWMPASMIDGNKDVIDATAKDISDWQEGEDEEAEGREEGTAAGSEAGAEEELREDAGAED